MKICFFGDGATYHLRRWAKYFANKGHKVDVITFNPYTLNGYGQIRLHVIKKRFPKPTLMWRALCLIPLMFDLKRLIKSINPDIIHSHSSGGYAWMPMLIEFHPFIVTPWGSDILIDIQKSKIEKFLTYLALKKADMITCDGENTKEAITNLGIDARKIRFITFGVDIERFKQHYEKKELRKSLALPNSKIVISTRFLTEIHDVKTFVKAIPLVLKNIPDVKFIIVGGGPQKEYLMNLAKNLGILNATKFTGIVSEEELVLYLNAADIYVSTSLSESGLAASTAEAMACELPVINTDTGDIRLWIKDGKGGFIIPTKHPEVLAEKIIYLLKTDEERIKFGKINRKMIEERNNYYIEMEKMEKIYKELIDGYKG